MAPKKGNLVFALILIVLGVWFTAVQLYPPVQQIAYGSTTWPFQVIGFGALLALAGLLAWAPGLMIPAAIIAGIGGLLYWQNLTGQWASWAFAWTLIPAFVAVGLLLFGLLARKPGAILGAAWTFFGSLVLFGVFGWAFGQLKLAGMVWPALLILLGLLVLISPRRRKAIEQRE